MRWIALVGVALATGSGLAGAAGAAKATDASVLREHVRSSYPSLSYVDRYRAAFPQQAQGERAFWAPAVDAALDDPRSIAQALAQLEDQHVALVGAKAGKAETLGALFRTSTDGGLVAWRVFATDGLREHDRVLAIDGMPALDWLANASALTFGGNRRGRVAEAALDLGLGSPVVHRIAGLASTVVLRVQTGDDAPRAVSLSYRPMSDAIAGDMADAIGRPDLPEVIDAPGVRIGTLRLGAFAPQYDSVFNTAADAAAAAAQPGATDENDDTAMLAGYCAMVAKLIARYDTIARESDVVAIDLRGNLGGFDRFARLEAEAIAPGALPRTFDFSASGTPGVVHVVEERTDPSCGHVGVHRPMLVLVDAGTRSAGEFMATWLWAAGATVVGEPTMGAGGGYEFKGSASFELPDSGYGVRLSGVFSIFDPAGEIDAGERPEAALVERITADRFQPSRARPFAIQSVGLQPDVAMPSTFADLQDGGRAQLVEAATTQRKP